jgi:Chitin synthase export chaperone
MALAYMCFYVDTLARGQGASAKVDGSFVATILETAAVGVIYLGWRSITEGNVTYIFIHICSVLTFTKPEDEWEEDINSPRFPR